MILFYIALALAISLFIYFCCIVRIKYMIYFCCILTIKYMIYFILDGEMLGVLLTITVLVFIATFTFGAIHDCIVNIEYNKLKEK